MSAVPVVYVKMRYKGWRLRRFISHQIPSVCTEWAAHSWNRKSQRVVTENWRMNKMIKRSQHYHQTELGDGGPGSSDMCCGFPRCPSGTSGCINTFITILTYSPYIAFLAWRQMVERWDSIFTSFAVLSTGSSWSGRWLHLQRPRPSLSNQM